MTSTVSNKKFSPFMHNMLCGIKSKTKIAIIIGILHIFAAPAAIISLIVSIYNKDPGDVFAAFFAIGAITTAIAGFIGIFIAIDSFSCLHTKSVVDMRLSLPLTASQRFFSNFLSGLAVYIGPFLAAQVISLLGMAYGFLFMEGRTFLEPWGYNANGEVDYVEYVCEYFGIIMPVLLKLILCGILVMLMLYTLTVLVTVCCGSKFESIAYTLLINIVIPLTIYIGFASMFFDLYGVDMALSLVIIRLIMYTSPAGGIMAAAEWCSVESFGSFFADDLNMNFAVWIIVYFLLTAAMGATAFFLYGKRRAEQVSKPFVFKLIYYIITAAAMFCSYSICHINHIKLAPMICATLIIYLTFEVAANRGFKKIWLSFIKYIGIMAASFLIIFSAQKTEGFGMVTRVPDISAVKSAEISYDGFYGLFSMYGYNNEGGFSMTQKNLTFTEKENIETIIAAHQSRVDTRDTAYTWGAGVNNVKIIYHLKNGGKITRQYDRFAPLQTEILSKLDLSDEYKAQVAEEYRQRILTSKQAYLEAVKRGSSISDWYDDFENLLGSVMQSVGANASSKIKTSKLANSGFYEEFADAYAADIMNINEENYYQSSARNPRYLNLAASVISHFEVPDTFENSLAVLKKYGFTVFDKAELSDRETYDFLKNICESSSEGICIYTAEEWREIQVVPDNVRLHANYESANGLQANYVNKIDKDLCDIFRASEIMNIVPDNGYIIYVLGQASVVPDELRGAAARVYEGSSEDNKFEYYDEYPFWLESTSVFPVLQNESTQ